MKHPTPLLAWAAWLGCLLTLHPAALSAQEQKGTKPARIGIFQGGATPPPAAFHQRLRELGYVEGRTVTFVVRNAHGRLDQYPDVAADIVRAGVDVIVTSGNAPLAAIKAATQKIPIVMAVVADPVGAGFVSSLAKPGGNITGMSNMAEGVSGKWLELIKHAAPDASRVAVLRDPGNRAHAQMLAEVQNAARKLNVTALLWDTRSAQEIDAAFAAMAGERIGAVVVLPHPTATVNARQISALAIKQRLPTVTLSPLNAEAGFLMSYGPSIPDLWRGAADYVDRILKGARPADLPVEQPTKFELVVNVRTAKALGITMPQSVLMQATRVIE